MFVNKVAIPGGSLSERFAMFFSDKVSKLTNDAKIDENVYNGTRKINSGVGFFMSSSDLVNIIGNLKMNKTGLQPVSKPLKQVLGPHRGRVCRSTSRSHGQPTRRRLGGK